MPFTLLPAPTDSKSYLHLCTWCCWQTILTTAVHWPLPVTKYRCISYQFLTQFPVMSRIIDNILPENFLKSYQIGEVFLLIGFFTLSNEYSKLYGTCMRHSRHLSFPYFGQEIFQKNMDLGQVSLDLSLMSLAAHPFWTCRILNFEYLFCFFHCAYLQKTAANIRYLKFKVKNSKFDMSNECRWAAKDIKSFLIKKK